MRIGVSVLALGLAAGIGLTARPAPSASDRARDPVPLAGNALRGKTGLRLLVASDPPFVLDVDTGSVMPVPGIRAMSRGALWVVGVGGRSAVVVARSAWKRAEIYAVRGREARVTSLGIGTNAWPAADGRAVWVQSAASGSRCTLRLMRLDGRRIRAPRPFPCAISDPAAGSLGLVARRTRVLDPHTGRLVLGTHWGVLAAAGTKLVLAGPGRGFTLLDGVTRAQQRLPWPSILGYRGRPAADPQGRFVALAFAVPTWNTQTLPRSWKGGPLQALDVWLLDTDTGKLAQLPGMPAFVGIKQTSLEWTGDGRLVLLGESNGKNLVAVWRPGQRRLALRTVGLERGGGSNSFAILR